MSRYPHLLAAGRIGALRLRNRIVLAAMGSNFAGADGHCNERLMAYYETRARGGAGLLVLETSAAFHPNGATMPNTIGFSRDEFIPGLRQLAQRVQRHGARIVAQLNHGGKASQEDTAAGRPIPVPSPVPRGGSDMFRVLTREEKSHFIKAAGPDGRGPQFFEMTPANIDEHVAGFAAAAARAHAAGFDGVEIHAGHGYLLAAFLSPHSNRREDDYGGSREKRARFLLEVIRAVRAATAAEFAILVRLDAMEYRTEGGIVPADCVATARLCESAGADAIDVSAYGNIAHAIAFTEAPLVHEPGGFVPFARAVKQAVDIPVIGVGRIEPEAGDRHIGSGQFDFLAMGRKLLADPDLPAKLTAGQARSVRPCIYCYICVSQIFINQPLCCAVNPEVGREHEDNILARTAGERHVLVVGGGPGGMETARLLATRGDRVTLWERERDLGGTARVAGLAYEPNQRLVRYLARAVRALPVEVHTGRHGTPETIAALAPNHVVLATGAVRRARPLAGREQRHVFDGDQLRGILLGNDADAIARLNPLQRLVLRLGRLGGVLRHIGLLRVLSRLWMPVAGDVVIIGGGLVGLELTEYLAERGRRLTVLEPGPALGAELSIVRRARVLHLLRERGVALHTNARIDHIGPAAVQCDIAGDILEIPCRQVIVALGAAADDRLGQELAARGLSVQRVGDCREVGYLQGAILDARHAVQSLDKRPAEGGQTDTA